MKNNIKINKDDLMKYIPDVTEIETRKEISAKIRKTLMMLSGFNLDITHINFRLKNIDKIIDEKATYNDGLIKQSELIKTQEEFFNMKLKYKDMILTPLDHDNLSPYGLLVQLRNEAIKITLVLEETTYFAIYVDPKKKPRMYIDCPLYNKCNSKVECSYKTTIGKPTCLKNAKTMQNCMKQDGQTTTEFLFSKLYLVYKINEYITNKKTKYKLTDNTKSKTTGSKQLITDKKDFLLITGEATKYLNITPTRTGTGTPKCEHERSGHWRNYKSGKRTWINQKTINEGKGKKDYLI